MARSPLSLRSDAHPAKSSLRLAGGLVVAAFLTAFSFAQTLPSGVISGHLASASGSVLSGVTLSLLPGDGGPSLASAITDATGAYHFDTVPFGRYVLHVALPGDIDQVIQLQTSRVVRDIRASGLTAGFSSSAKSPAAGKAPPLFLPSGVQGTTAPSGYSGGASDEDAEQLRAHTASSGLDPLLLSGQSAPACDQRQPLLREVALHPDRFQAQHDLGMLALAHGDGQEAVRSLEAAHRLQPSDIANDRALATAYLRLGRYADAGKLLEPLLSTKPADASLLLLSAEVNASQGASSEARSQFLKAAAASNQPDLIYAAGIGLLQLNLAADARIPFRQALDRFPDSVSVETGLGMAQAGSGEKELGAKTLLSVVRRDPNASAAYPVLARLTGISPELDRQITNSIQSHVLAHPEDAEAHYDTAVMLWRVNRNHAGSRDQIRQELLRAVALAPGRSDAHLLLGVVDAEDGQKDQAVKELEASLMLMPGSAQAHYRLALVDRDLGRTSESDQEMKRFLALRTQGKTIEGEAMDGVASASPGGAEIREPRSGTPFCSEEIRPIR